MVVMSALCRGRALLPRNIFWCSFLLEIESTTMHLEGLGTLKQFRDIGKWIPELAVLILLPDPTTLPSAPPAVRSNACQVYTMVCQVYTMVFSNIFRNVDLRSYVDCSYVSATFPAAFSRAIEL
jgi:hypothetical protein